MSGAPTQTYRINLPAPILAMDLSVSAKGVTTLHFLPASSASKRAAKLKLTSEAPSASPTDRASMDAHAQAACDALESYAATGKMGKLPKLDMQGTDFQQRVWSELVKVKPGVTLSYGELATRIGSPAASRAVGGAMARNPLPIFVPCHRVLASSGKLGGFTGGLSTKAKLLAHEGRSEFLTLFANA